MNAGAGTSSNYKFSNFYFKNFENFENFESSKIQAKRSHSMNNFCSVKYSFSLSHFGSGSETPH